MLISIDQIDESEARFDSWKGKSGRQEATSQPEEALIAEISDAISEKVSRGNILGPSENLAKRKEMIEAVGQEPLDFAFERAIGKNDSVYTNFVELIAAAKQKVGRIVIKNVNQNIGFATGFMVSENLLLTNWHVFKTIESVAESEVQFYYELDTHGNPGSTISFKLKANDFFYSFKELDYCFVAVNDIDVTGTIPLSTIGYIYLDPSLGKLGNEREERLNIIHHPDGDYKQLSIRENLFTKIMPTTMWYESDTAQGSSGSPVFNDQWQVVGLHHMGVPSRNAQGDYLDKDGRVVPKIGNKVDAAKIHWIANEGIRVSVILKDIFEKYPQSALVDLLKKAPPFTPATPITENKPTLQQEQKTTNMEPNNNGQVNISFPASLIEANGNINIQINNQGKHPNANLEPVKRQESGGGEEDFTEVRKIEVEDGIDYSGYKGYQSKFLGVDIPLPLPRSQKFIAKLKNSDSIVLKYQYYSVIMNAVRMMPIISAINVDGDTGKRLDKTKRGTDVWYRDNRMDYDIQLNDKYYRGSGFDRGHMSRREDANWGKTAEDARLFADMTCMYTNACPQINTLNQEKRGGLWGKLETIVLEKGAIQERGTTAKISVFNGPVFSDQDSVYAGIQVPMLFYKIILWLNDDKEPKATAFKLSQSDLVGDIDFEAIDIDQNVEFREYQCSIKSLQKDTGIDFSHIFQFDTYDPNEAHESMEITSELELNELINRHAKSKV